LTNVVVNSSEVAGKILQHGRMQRRTTFLPLDKMKAHVISQQELKNAQRLVGADNVHRAIDLVRFDRVSWLSYKKDYKLSKLRAITSSLGIRIDHSRLPPPLWMPTMCVCLSVCH
jgi:hypothetical protein